VAGHAPWSATVAREVLEALPSYERLMLPALQCMQRTFGYVPDEALDVVADFLNVSRAEVYGVLTFYHDLRRAAPPRTDIKLCVAEACQAQGSRELVAAVEEAYGVRLGEVNSDVEISEVFCLGDCALGPAAMINGRLRGRCTVDSVRAAVTA
jgi:formate dehydrogenase subunit gamma